MNRADPRAGQHRNRRLGNHRQVNNDAIAFFDSVTLEDVREQANLAMQLFVGVGALLADFSRARRLAFPDQRRFIRGGSAQMFIEAVVADIELAADEPFCVGHFPLQDFFPGGKPGQFVLRLLRPELFRRLDRFVVELFVFGQRLDVRRFGELLRWFEHTIFVRKRGDVLCGGRFGFVHKNKCVRAFYGESPKRQRSSIEMFEY